MVVDDYIEGMVLKDLEVGGLTIQNGRSVELAKINLLNPLHGDAEQFDQGNVLLPGYFTNIGRRGVFYGFQKQGLQGETAGDGIGVGLDEYEQPILGGKELPQIMEVDAG